ncbi:MAG TPA: class I SAM-dependent methyltransferase [Candidatus Sulfomarinibacteraceae bacterium]|nr:class I SAM-dependent methyltransferase [Candidatus Sulfomarinibacteraceae bacterium]
MTREQEGKSLPSTLYDEEYFLTACEGYDVFLESEGEHLSRRLNDAFAVADVQPGMRILDVGCGRGEILRHCMRLGVHAFGIDYAEIATRMSLRAIQAEQQKNDNHQDNSRKVGAGVCRSDAKKLPFPDASFDRVLMFDVVEHLYPWELQEAMLEVHRVLRPEGRFIVHTAPNRWYDQYAYPWVRRFRQVLGQGDRYPPDPRAITPVNQEVHVNEQDILSMRRALKAAGFRGKVWLDSPPRGERENALVDGLRWFAFHVPPFRWFFERELFAVAQKGQ